MEKTFKTYLESQLPEHLEKIKELMDWISTTYPNLEKAIKWNQPMWLDHQTFIIGFSTASKHIAISPEPYVIQLFLKDIEAAGYNATSNLFRITWKDEFNFDLLKKLIDFQIEDKKEFKGFWRT